MTTKNHHIDKDDRIRWDKTTTDFNEHKGTGGVTHHPLGNGTIPGFSTNDYDNTEKNKLRDLAKVATTGSYIDLIDQPTSMKANGGNADTVGGKTVSEMENIIKNTIKTEQIELPPTGSLTVNTSTPIFYTNYTGGGGWWSSNDIFTHSYFANGSAEPLAGQNVRPGIFNGISAGTYTVASIIQKLVNRSHGHGSNNYSTNCNPGDGQSN